MRRNASPPSESLTSLASVSQANSAKSFAQALQGEYEALLSRIAETRGRADRLRALAEQAERLAGEEERYLRELEGLLGIAPQLRIETLNVRLRGQRLLEVALEILSRERGAGVAIHYREWYELLRAAGHEVGGKDPVGNFLAHIARAPEVERILPRSGLYRLRAIEENVAQPRAA
jgi:hypothetical protein